MYGRAGAGMSDLDARRITTDPDPFEAFNISLGFRIADMIYLSGQASVDDAGNVVGTDDFDAQATKTFENIEQTLKLAGSSMGQIVKVTIYLTDMKYFPKILALREKHFTRPYPADTIVEVSALGLPELMIEIDVMALAKGRTVE